MGRELRKELRKRLARPLARLLARPRCTAAEVRGLRPARVLVIRQHNQMGDMVCATPAFRALRRTYPDAEIGLVCAPLNHQVVRHSPDLDAIFLFDKRAWRRPARLWRLTRRLRNFSPDLAFVLNSVSFSLTSALLALLSGARIVVGGQSGPFGWDFSRHAYSLELPSRPEVDRNAVQHSLAPLAAIGIEPDDRDTVVVPAPAERREAAALLAGLPGDGPLWVMHPGAGKTVNLWPAERFAEIAAAAVAAGGSVLLLHGPADREAVRRFRAAAARIGRRPEPRLVIAPPLPVGTCAALLARADRFLCNDTGLMHVAGAVGVPTVALFGPTDPALWKPPAGTVQAVRAPGGDLGRLDVDTVWRACAELPPRRNDGPPRAGGGPSPSSAAGRGRKGGPVSE